MNNFQVDRHTSTLAKAPRAARACALCHDRKVRCDLGSGKSRCSTCQRDGQKCEPRQRQRNRKRVDNKLFSSPRGTHRKPIRSSSASTQPVESLHQATGSPQDVNIDESIWMRGLENQQEADPSGAPDFPSPVTSKHAENQRADPTSNAFAVPTPASTSTAYESGFMERSAYIAPDKFRGEDGHQIYQVKQTPSEVHTSMLHLQKAFELPPRAIRDGLFEKFWTYCYPWEPIIERTQIIGTPIDKVCPFLLQAIFLAGSRMSSSSRTSALPQDFYHRAKALFWLDAEKDPFTTLIGVSLLHWWNPHGPERVSTNTSGFWIRVAVGLAYQIGLHNKTRPMEDESLRRRIWWSLVARDCLISLAHGRPQAINLEDCDVPLPTLEDFPNSHSAGQLFLAYVGISTIVGDFTTYSLRKETHKEQRTQIQNALYRWIKTLPESLRFCESTPEHSLKEYNFEVRQLHMIYFVMIVLVFRSSSLEGPHPTTAVIASSYIAGMFEDFLARDEIRYLNPVFTFYLLAAAIAQLSCYKYTALWPAAQEDLKIISQAQEELAMRWPSAFGSIKSFDRMYKLTTTSQRRVNGLPENLLTAEQAIFFEDMGPDLCRLWGVLTNTGMDQSKTNGTDFEASGCVLPRTASMEMPFSHGQVSIAQTSMLVEGNNEGNNSNYVFEDEVIQPGAIGDWLFWDSFPFEVS